MGCGAGVHQTAGYSTDRPKLPLEVKKLLRFLEKETQCKFDQIELMLR